MPDAEDEDAHQDPDMVLRPDPATLCVAPGFKTPTAYVFADALHPDGSPWDASPREVLKRVVAFYTARLAPRPIQNPSAAASEWKAAKMSAPNA